WGLGLTLASMTSQDDLERSIRLLSDPSVETAWRLDALLDLERTDDPRITPVLLAIVANPIEPRSLRLAVLRHLRDTSSGADVANALRRLLRDHAATELDIRIQAALALGDCTSTDDVIADLGAISADQSEPFDLRYAAFTSLQRAGPTPASVAALRQLAED